MKTIDEFEIVELSYPNDGHIDEKVDVDMNMMASILAVEKLIGYQFKNKKLLEEALTHSSYSDSTSYQRLEFIGDAALGLALSNFVFITYPSLDPGQLSLLRSANISTEKLARVAVRHGFYRFLRHNAPPLDEKVKEFICAVGEEDDLVVHGGVVKAPKVLADMVESIAAAIYVDCEFNLKALWDIFGDFLEPIITLENLQQQPVTMLFEHCQKHGKQVHIEHWRNGSKNIASVFVDGKHISSSDSEQKDIAKLNAAKEALLKLLQSEPANMEVDRDSNVVNELEEIEGAKHKLYEFCGKKRWGKPSYRVEKEVGPSHDRRFVCSVQIETKGGVYVTSGDVRARVKDAENSAASMMLHGLECT